MENLTVRAVVTMIEAAVKDAGSQAVLAKRWGVSAAYLCDIRHRRRAPGKAVLRHLGLEQVTTYRRRRQ